MIEIRHVGSVVVRSSQELNEKILTAVPTNFLEQEEAKWSNLVGA